MGSSKMIASPIRVTSRLSKLHIPSPCFFSSIQRRRSTICMEPKTPRNMAFPVSLGVALRRRRVATVPITKVAVTADTSSDQHPALTSLGLLRLSCVFLGNACLVDTFPFSFVNFGCLIQRTTCTSGLTGFLLGALLHPQFPATLAFVAISILFGPNTKRCNATQRVRHFQVGVVSFQQRLGSTTVLSTHRSVSFHLSTGESPRVLLACFQSEPSLPPRLGNAKRGVLRRC
mmetsp:Transcript_5801/g.36007  ORF Transcript_5801/g.36007 Transcript_5801/m.36007 type:complete len:231 (-) Transcript_5801:81-773(-)